MRLTPAVLGGFRRVGRRRALVMLDQGTSSLSNVVVTVMVARMVAPAEFGAFAVALLAYQLATGAVRAVVGEPWLSAHSTDEGAARDRGAADLLRGAVAVSLAASLVIAAAAVVAGGRATGALLGLAIVYPFLGVQDALRYLAVVDRPQVALVSDLTWLVGVVALLAVAPAGVTPAWYVVAWGVAGAAGLAVALVTVGVPLRSGRALRWLVDHRGMAGAFLAEMASARAVGQVVLLGLGVIAGLPALAAVRAAQVFYGPLNTLFDGLYLAVVPDGARRRDEPGRLRRLMVATSVLVTAAAGVWMLVGLVLPDAWGHALFGDTWALSEDVMLPVGLAVMAGSAATGGLAGLRSLAAADLSLRARLWSLPPQALFSLGGAVAGGAVGYACGFAIGNAVMAATWWSFFAYAIRTREAKHFAPRPGAHAATGSSPGSAG